MDRVSSRARLWAVERVGLRSHPSIGGLWKGKGVKAFEGVYGFPWLALVKTLFFCQCNSGGFDWAICDLDSRPVVGPLGP